MLNPVQNTPVLHNQMLIDLSKKIRMLAMNTFRGGL